jgi:hypothetical protein
MLWDLTPGSEQRIVRCWETLINTQNAQLKHLPPLLEAIPPDIIKIRRHIAAEKDDNSFKCAHCLNPISTDHTVECVACRRKICLQAVFIEWVTMCLDTDIHATECALPIPSHSTLAISTRPADKKSCQKHDPKICRNTRKCAN